jgi:hypothetical protein
VIHITSRTTVLLAAAGAVLACIGPAANAESSANGSCLGQFFSSHAGLGAAHTGETVGSFTSAAARQLQGLGQTFREAHLLDRQNCEL